MTPNDLNKTAAAVSTLIAVFAASFLAAFFVGVGVFLIASALLGWGAM